MAHAQDHYPSYARDNASPEALPKAQLSQHVATFSAPGISVRSSSVYVDLVSDMRR